MPAALPLMLLPGLLCDDTVWRPLLPTLDAGLAPQVVDYGLLDDLGQMAERVLALAPPGPFALAGHSMGGRVALEVVRRAPERVARLALLDTGVHGLAPGAAGEQEAAGRWRLVDLARQAGMRAMGTEWARGMVPENRWHEPLFEEILQMIERRTPELFAAQQRALLGRRDSAEVLAGVRVPTLILCGEEDRWSPPAQHVAMAALCTGARLVRVAHAGHMVTMEDPAAVSAALRDWARA